MKTMGMVVVAALAGSEPFANVTITATWRRTKSAANSVRRSTWFWAKRYVRSGLPRGRLHSVGHAIPLDMQPRGHACGWRAGFTQFPQRKRPRGGGLSLSWMVLTRSTPKGKV
jgi:hypothetical protein